MGSIRVDATPGGKASCKENGRKMGSVYPHMKFLVLYFPTPTPEHCFPLAYILPPPPSDNLIGLGWPFHKAPWL